MGTDDLEPVHREEHEAQCGVCHDLIPETWENLVPSFLRYSKIRKAADDGCLFCACMAKVLQHYYFPHGQGPTHLQDIIDVQATREELVLRSRGFNNRGIMFYASPGAALAWESLPYAPDICLSAGSNKCLATAQSWMLECRESHERCKQNNPIDPSRQPRRIMDLGSADDKMKLVELPAGGIGTGSPYAALSHCWGKHRPLETTKSTLDQRKQKLEWTFMPATFQDAIKVTRSLGLRYLWIDSLCIVQDDEHDWACESAKMGFIYEHAQIVIAATSSSDPTRSFLASRENPHANPLEMRFDRSDGTQCVVKARPLVELHRSAEPLDTRAWTWQEQRLAVRLLRYTTAELMWHCRTTTACECESTHSGSPFDIMQGLMYGRYCETTTDADMPAAAVFRQWRDMLHAYTMRGLTRASDKLPALSGIAARIHQTTGSIFLAGMWRDSLVSDLGWRTCHSRYLSAAVQSAGLWRTPEHLVKLVSSADPSGFLKLRSLETYRAPTFSWASIEGETIEYRHSNTDYSRGNTDTIEAVVLDARCTLKGPNPFGEVTDGYIILKARLAPANVIVATDHRRGKMGTYEVHREGMMCFMEADLPLIVDRSGLTQSGERNWTVRRARWGESLEHGSSIATGPMFCLSLWHCGCTVTMLALGRSSSVQGAYERIGLAEYSASEEWFAGVTEETVRIV